MTYKWSAMEIFRQGLNIHKIEVGMHVEMHMDVEPPYRGYDTLGAGGIITSIVDDPEENEWGAHGHLATVDIIDPGMYPDFPSTFTVPLGHVAAKYLNKRYANAADWLAKHPEYKRAEIVSQDCIPADLDVTNEQASEEEARWLISHGMREED